MLANSKRRIDKQDTFDTMVEFVEKLSNVIMECRVDFYYIAEKIYFGKITFYNSGIFVPFDPPEWDYYFGQNIQLKVDR